MLNALLSLLFLILMQCRLFVMRVELWNAPGVIFACGFMNRRWAIVVRWKFVLSQGLPLSSSDYHSRWLTAFSTSGQASVTAVVAIAA